MDDTLDPGSTGQEGKPRIFDPVSGAVVPLAPGPDLTPTRMSLSGLEPETRAARSAVAAPPSAAPTSAAPTIPDPRSPAQTPPARRGVSRRAVLIGAGVGAVGLGAAGASLGAVLLHQAPRRHATSLSDLLSTDAAKINHLLRRAGFGPTPSEIGDYLAAGVQGSISRLLNYSSVADDLDGRLSQLTFDFTNPRDLIRWFLLRMIYTRRPLEEKMTLFWHGVLTSSFAKLGKRDNYPLMIQQNKLLRARAMGRFDDLVHDMTIDPAMLAWLDGRASTGKAPNENYARELMELFTMGIYDVDGKPNYTQDDVHQGALALAGWTVQDGKGVLIPNRQYTGQATFLGKTGKLGLAEVVQLVCAHPATGRFLAWKLWSFFAYETTLADPVLQPLADAYDKSNHTISAMVKAMLNSPAFFGDKAYRARVKSPVEFVVTAARGLGLAVNGQGLAEATTAMGQILFDPPNVSGWDGDKVSGNWLATQSWMTRVNFINQLVAAATGAKLGKTSPGGDAPGAGGAPVQQLLTSYGLKSTGDVASYFIASLLDNHLADDRRAILRDALANATTAGPALTLVGGGTVAAAGVRAMLYLLMAMPEFQMS